jgi:hypothetical protein
MRIAFLLFVASLIAGCENPSSQQDAKLKSTLVGSWYYEYKNAQESMVKGVLEHSETGTFKAREKIFQTENPPEEKSAGTWHVTSGLFKLLTNEVDGKHLASQKYLYFTCKVTAFSSDAFSCHDEVANQSYSYKRVPSDFKLS